MGGEEGDETEVRDSVVEGEAQAPIAQTVAVDVPTSRVKEEEVTEIPVNVNVRTRWIPQEPATRAADVTSESMDIDADAEIAAEMQMGETQPGSIVGGDSACIDEELLAEYMRVKAWQKWRISDFATIAAGISFMEPEEEFSLKWLNTSYIPEATSFALIDDVYSKKLAAREAEKGKFKAADEESQSRTPKDAETVFQKDFRRAMQQSRLEQEMEGPGSTSAVGTRRPIREITPEQPTRSPGAREAAVLRSFPPARSEEGGARNANEKDKEGFMVNDEGEDHASGENKETPRMETNINVEYVQVPPHPRPVHDDQLLSQMRAIAKVQKTFFEKMNKSAKATMAKTSATKRLVNLQRQTFEEIREGQSAQTKDVTQTLQCAEEAMNKMWGLVTRMANKVEFMEQQAAAVQKKLSKIDEKMYDVYDKVGDIPAMNDKIDVISDGVINLHDKLNVFIDDAKKGEGSRRPPRRFGSSQQRASGSTSTSKDIVPIPDESYSLQNLLDYAKTWNMIHFKNEEIRKQKKQEDEREREDEERKKRQRIMEQQTEKEILAKLAKYKEGTRLDSD
nr:protein MAK16 homolog [Ipomoea batatas]